MIKTHYNGKYTKKMCLENSTKRIVQQKYVKIFRKEYRKRNQPLNP